MKHPKPVNKLITALQRLIRALAQDGDRQWKEWFENGLALLRRGDYRGAVRHIQGAYGGMGSFTDAVGTAGDDSLGQLAMEVYQLADEVH